MLKDDLRKYCAELNRCNQRGGRMLSVFDLIEADTLPLDLASFLMSHIMRGASFLVGARPGGAGKTTVMCGLLTLTPTDCEAIAATPTAIREAVQASYGNRCLICHEIGSGPYFAYLWGKDLRDYCALSEKGAMLVTNLHADDLNEAEYQICRENGVPLPHFYAFQLAIFLHVERSTLGLQRRIDTVYASDGTSPHRLVYDHRHGLKTDFIDPDCYRFLKSGLATGIRTIEDTRQAVVDFLRKEDMNAKM